MAGFTLVASCGGLVTILTMHGPDVIAAAEESQGTVHSTLTTAPPTGAPVLTTTTTSPRTTTTKPNAALSEPELPACEPGEQQVEGDPITDWGTVVVDPARGLPASFTPPDIVEMTGNRNDPIRIRDIVVDDLRAMIDAAQRNGTPLVLISGYRSYEYQANLFQDDVEELGEDAAALITARPGHSEHQLGTVVDVLNVGAEELTTGFADTRAGQWVARNAADFGFVVSYPRGAREQSCYSFEPWHLRYVGRQRAQQIVESGLTPREWMLANG